MVEGTAGPLWHVLGAGSSLPQVGLGPSGYALRPAPGARVTLFDCGPGSLRSLPAQGIALEEVERVVISHLHLDHCLDLISLAFALRNPQYGGPEELEIIGPPGITDWLARAEVAFGASATFRAARITEVEPREDSGAAPSLQAGALRLSWAPTGHQPGRSLAWRTDLDGGSVAYSGDAIEEPALARLAAGVDLFVCECSFEEDEPGSRHLGARGAARLARAAGVRRLLLTHFYPGLDLGRVRTLVAGIYDGPLDLARDGSQHPFKAAAPSR